MKPVDWDKEKNEWLKRERGISFEDILIAYKNKQVIAIIDHPNSKKYPNQKIYVVNIHEYAYLVPFVEDEEKVFLKTIFPSRKATKKYITGGKK
ncbi:MAG: BrnT family toxin [Candidatus Levybacteria bacterium]|nr:BrnT family toxin [Candidatus Levybacteria bacterium]